MNCTVNVLCYKSKTLLNGEHPLMICASKDGKRKYLSLGVSIHPKYWDFEKNKPKRHCPNKEIIQNLINSKISEYSKQVLELKSLDKDFSANNIIKERKKNVERCTVGEFFDKYIILLEAEDRLKYASTFKELKSSIKEHCKSLDIYFSEIDIDWLKSYETWLKSKGLSLNSIGVRFRTLRALYNRAMDANIVKSEHYPFKKYKVSKLHQETAKRAMTKNDIQNIINYDTTNKDCYTKLAIDLFTYSYLMGGINFTDMAYLTNNHVVGNQLVYVRKKTKKQIKFPIHPIALQIHEKYNDNKYLFPVLSNYHKTEIQKANRIHKVLAKVNKALKNVGEELKLPITLTTYVARHSFATVLKRSGVSTSIISESLGHSSEKITQIYLDSFENEQINAAMVNLL